MPYSNSGVTTHYSPGTLPVAFVFSVPGAREKSAGAPVAGTAGENLSFALAYLHARLPAVFASPDRYAYRITNAYKEPFAKSLGDESSQARDSQILESANVKRVLRELDGCRTVILCGLKAQLLADEIRKSHKMVVCAWHTSNRALSGKYKTTEVTELLNSLERRKKRAELWAREILRKLGCRDVT